jgi:hypothetical protein
MNKPKPICPIHKTKMGFSSRNIDPWRGKTLTIRGKEVPNEFHYCRERDCAWRYSSELEDYFKATDI